MELGGPLLCPPVLVPRPDKIQRCSGRSSGVKSLQKTPFNMPSIVLELHSCHKHAISKFKLDQCSF